MRRAERIRYLALAVQREGNRQLTELLRPLGLSPAQSEVLRILGDHAPMTLTELGRMLVCDSGENPSRLVDKLVSRGLVDRRPATEDRRRVVLTLTPEGIARESDVRAIEDGVYDAIDSVFPAAEADSLLASLLTMVAGSPAGNALATRIAAESGQGGDAG
jgi:MarR family transcriptional regulator, organic hydroperoxide resistance regulator